MMPFFTRICSVVNVGSVGKFYLVMFTIFKLFTPCSYVRLTPKGRPGKWWAAPVLSLRYDTLHTQVIQVILLLRDFWVDMLPWACLQDFGEETEAMNVVQQQVKSH